MKLITGSPGPSYARVRQADGRRSGSEQFSTRWHPDPEEHRAALAEGIRTAADARSPAGLPAGAHLESVLRRDPRRPPTGGRTRTAERRTDHRRSPANWPQETGVYVHASLWEERPGHELGYNTAVVMAPDGTLAASDPQTAHSDHGRLLRGPILRAGARRTRSLPHAGSSAAPSSASPPAGTNGSPSSPGPIRSPAQPCWSTRPPSDPSRTILLRHRTLVGESHHRQRHRQRHVHGGSEPHRIRRAVTFYGSSFISDPYGRKLVQAPRDEPAVLVADLDIDQRSDWLDLFPFLTTRRPDAYGTLVENPRSTQD